MPDSPEPFLLAMLANPADDAPRLILADWLVEQGADDEAKALAAVDALDPGREGKATLTRIRQRCQDTGVSRDPARHAKALGKAQQ